MESKDFGDILTFNEYERVQRILDEQSTDESVSLFTIDSSIECYKREKELAESRIKEIDRKVDFLNEMVKKYRKQENGLIK